MVAPGCWPEWCLVEDFDGLTGVCRPCATRQLEEVIMAAFPDLPVLLQQVLQGALRQRVIEFIL